MNEHLYLFQIGPVQSFIAAARRTQDLYVGSWLLSSLAAAGVEEAQRSGAAMQFPAADASGELPEGVPHRFAFTLDAESPAQVASQIEGAIRQRWQENIVIPVRDWLLKRIGDGSWVDEFDSQLDGWLEFYWVAVPTAGKSHGEAYKAAGAALAARKQARHFPQISDAPQLKCTVTGAAAALQIDWNRLRSALGEPVLRENEQLGALALVKRVLGRVRPEIGDASFRSTVLIAGNPPEQDRETDTNKLKYPYLAILHMDGDRMGMKLADLKSARDHQEFSSKLSDFARLVRDLIPAPGELVYAGGDDVLALLPLNQALKCADAIRTAFERTVGGTMSAGVAIMSVNTPLDSALEAARLAEKRAKKDYGRSAIVVRDVRSTAIREAGAQWTTGGQPILTVMDDLQARFDADQLSGKLGYDLLEIASAMSGNLPPEARKGELRRLIKRRSGEGTRLDADALTGQLAPLGESLAFGWESLANWVILARFLAKGGRRE